MGYNLPAMIDAKVRCYLPVGLLPKYKPNDLGNYYVYVDAVCLSIPMWLCESCIKNWASQECQMGKLFHELKERGPNPRHRPKSQLLRWLRPKERHA